ncbi:hypothetical protein ACIPW9_27630 [Streptomyces sp. NPDC090052]|uniref:hypothetical protein n=1 Tax=unclassified Streptomyces TaxID=2593676 RepID=UPI002E1C21C2|nr:hypothetical protein OG372_18290 [Streptomyces sp. NBC_01020]WSX43416.1 hypothetical protein OG760_17940 [Streptomyces sp. NBC_00963]WSX68557.1 hypothetical protein OG221_19070 [Streptomyces sp. NBC_00932]
MTSTADTSQHPDVSEIADLAEGLLAPSRAVEMQQHIDACSLCSDVRGSLQEIQELLATAPGPVLMPADIAERMDVALAAESLLEATPREGAAHVSRETSLPPRSAEPVHGKRPSGRPRATTGPGRSRTARRRRHVAALSAVLGAAVIGIGVFFLQSSPTASSGDTSAAGKTSKRAGTPVFIDAALQDQVHSLLASDTTASTVSPQEKKAPSVHMDSGPTTLKNGPDVAVPPCVEKGIGREEGPIAAQKGIYKGSDAFLVVLPHPTDSTRVQVYVVDAACVHATPSTRGKVLLTHVYPRG